MFPKAVIGSVIIILGISNIALVIWNRGAIDRNYKQVKNFQSRIGDRWDYLQRENPTLKVPRNNEPSNEAHQTDAELDRTKQ